MTDHAHWLCNAHAHLSRRTLLGAGASGLMMSSIASRLARADETSPRDRPKNLILVWLEGGPSQLETFDPHAGTKIGGEVKAIATSVKGLQIADTLPQTAEWMHTGSLIRSVTSKEGDHARAIYNVKTGFRPDPTLDHPAVGAVLLDAFPEQADLPRYISIAGTNYPGRGGYLGAKYDAFKIFDPAGQVPDIVRRVDDERYNRRIKDLLGEVETEFARGRLRDLERNRTLHETATNAALKMMSSAQLSAFDVNEEPRAVRAEFGNTVFGRGCLAATRLLGAGVRCVEVTLTGWDSHVNNHGIQSSQCEKLDSGLASLLKRLDERNMLSNTLVVCAGEFGRTPKINVTSGRDHHPHGFSVFMAGCGIRKGFVYGETSANPKLAKENPLQDVDNPVAIEEIHATIMKCLGIDHTEELDTPVGRPLRRIKAEPIAELIG